MFRAFIDFVNSFFKLFQWWVILDPWQMGLRVRLGKHVRSYGPGIHLCVPFLDQFFVESVRTRMSGLETQTLTTSDNQTITLSGTFGYCISDLRKLFDTLYQPEDSLRNLVESEIAQYVATHTLLECSPLTISQAVELSLDFSKYGIGCLQVRIVEYARVKTYRLIQGDRDTPWSGLSTSRRADAQGGSGIR